MKDKIKFSIWKINTNGIIDSGKTTENKKDFKKLLKKGVKLIEFKKQGKVKMTIEDKMAELIVLCQKVLITGENTRVKVDGKYYYAMFSFKQIKK